MEVRLEHDPKEPWTCTVSLRIRSSSGQQRDVSFGDVLTNPDDVEQRLRRAQRAVLRPDLNPKLFLDDSDRAFEGNNSQAPLAFTDNCVCIHIRGPEVTDLHFYDLPGAFGWLLLEAKHGPFTTTCRCHCKRAGGSRPHGHRVGSIHGQELRLPRGLHRLTCGLVRECVNPNLCDRRSIFINWCSADFENQSAGRLVRELDPRGQNTVGPSPLPQSHRTSFISLVI